MTSVLVCGAAGFLGSHLADRLVERGENVLAYDDLSEGRLENLDRSLPSRRLTFLYAPPDSESSDVCEVIQEGADAPIKLAVIVAPPNPARDAAVVACARRYGAPVVVVSTSGDCALPGNANVAARVRARDVFGPRMELDRPEIVNRVFGAVRDARPFPIQAIAQSPIAPTYVDSVVDAVIATTERRDLSDLAVIGAPPIALGELCERLASIASVPFALGPAAGEIELVAQLPGEPLRPRIDLDTALRQTVEWLKTRPSVVA